MTEALTEEIPEWKKEEIQEFEELLEGHDGVGAVNIEGIASKQFQQVRKNLHGLAVVRVGRNTLMKRALESQGRDELLPHVEGQTGLVFTDENPFRLYRAMEEGKSPAPIKEGQEAPHDIVVPEGDTGFEPGPFVGDLQQAGVSARIEDGSIKVMEDSVVLEEGEEADAEVAEILRKLDIYPIEVGLDLRAFLDDGTVFDPDTLAIDVDEYRSDFESAAAGAYNLAVNAGVANATTAELLLSKAFGQAAALGVEAEVFEPEVLERLIGRADSGMRSLASRLDEDARPDDLEVGEVEDSGQETEEMEEEEPEAAEAEDETEEAGAEQDDEDTEDDVAEGMGNLF